MVVLENVNVNDLRLEKFRNFKCLCELCDCGCFDRSKQTHHPECKNKLTKAKISNVRPLTSSQKTCPVSHYKETFRANYNARPATVYRPPIEQYDYLPRGSIDLNTTQKTEFKPVEIKGRLKSCKHADNHVLSTEPFNGVSSYQAEYYNKPNNGLSNIVKRNSNETTIRVTADTISTNTTSNEHFKDWHAKPPPRGYNEYPSYAGEALFPTAERNFNTSTSLVHKSMPLPKKNRILRTNVEAKGSYKNEGPMDLNSNYRETFVKFNDAERAKLINPENKSRIFTDGPTPFSAVTQSRSDYVHYLKPQRPQLADCNPYESNLNEQLYPGTKYDHATSYSTQYTGIDVKKNPKAKSCKKENIAFQLPTEKVDGETVTMRDFKPIDISKIPILKAHAVLGKLSVPGGKMETKTMSMLQFLPYEIKPVVHASDPCPDIYIPPLSKFQTETTNNQTYRGAKGNKSLSFKPDFKNIESTGSIELNTNYRDNFINHGLTLCEAKAFLIAKAITDKNEKSLPTYLNENGRSKTSVAFSVPKTPLIN